ncbi:MAG: GNAT family N-acetyltransferase [Anaerolineales bacterium]|nr:GNAT family N-acetyltransferase [Anaerolineales bacterium]
MYSEAYTHSDSQYQEMWDLLVKSYTLTGRMHNWTFARLENWRYASCKKEPREYYLDKVRLWRDASGELVGFCIAEGEGDCISMQTLPGYEEIESDMLAWVEQDWGAEKAKIEIPLYDYDEARKALLADCGYTDAGHVMNMRTYDLSQGYSGIVLPEGFRVTTLAEYADYEALIETERLTFNSDYLDRAWFDGKASAPSYDYGLHFIIIAPDERPAAFALGWIDAHNQAAEVDPVGTHPEFRKRGLAKAAVVACFQELAQRGARRAYIASGAEPNPSNFLYESLQPSEKFREHLWEKRLD